MTDHKGHTVLGFIPFDEKTGKEGGMVKAESNTVKSLTGNKEQSRWLCGHLEQCTLYVKRSPPSNETANGPKGRNVC